jgi:hypothetical protein
MVSRSDSIYFRIFGEKCSNFVQKAAQFFEKLKIVGNRIIANHKLRAGRHSSPDPSCRPARFIAGFLGNFRNEGEGRARRKNQGAVADQRLLTGCYLFCRKHNRKSHCSKRPISASIESVTHPTHISERLPRFPTVANRNRGARPPYRYVLGANKG